jgi:UDP-N-acetylglucosamine--N-acetylmuramyl-(pentapeptide) pyrophosphoryl-undecaprenol N-acetylglucosamine transferase
MTFLIAAAGTGGHVYPGLSVGDALVDLGIDKEEILFVGGDRLEAKVYPEAGYRFHEVELAGLKRSMTVDNARIPTVVMRARRSLINIMGDEGVDVALGMGGYVTLPVALAARSCRVPFYNAEQNAEAGLANKMTARWARVSFVAFPRTGGIPRGKWVGNPVRRAFWEFDRTRLRPAALAHFDLDPDAPVVGVFGGSLGSAPINHAVSEMVSSWTGPPLQIVHLTGASHLEEMAGRDSASGVSWRRVGFEENMELFFAVSDLVIARAGGAVAELTATATPSILVPGQFGSGGHQSGNARFLAESGAATVVEQEDLSRLPEVVSELLGDQEKLLAMATASRAIAKPDAARTIANTMIEAAR